MNFIKDCVLLLGTLVVLLSAFSIANSESPRKVLITIKGNTVEIELINIPAEEQNPTVNICTNEGCETINPAWKDSKVSINLPNGWVSASVNLPDYELIIEEGTNARVTSNPMYFEPFYKIYLPTVR